LDRIALRLHKHTHNQLFTLFINEDLLAYSLLSRPHSLSKDQPYPLRIRAVEGNLAVVSHQATIPTRTRALQDELTQAGTVPTAKYTPRYTHNMRQSILRFILTSPRHSSDFLRTNLCTTIDSQVPSPLPQMTTRWPAPALRGVQYAGHFGANNIEQQLLVLKSSSSTN
jgi:hypothetical protein